MSQPNIFYIHAHDLGRFCEPMGHNIPAPNLLKLAQQGVLFRQTHCSAPTCAPSRAAMMTGQHPHVCGMLGLPSPHLKYRLHDYGHHLGQYFKDQGYVTALSGVQHVARPPMAPMLEVLPYDHFLNHTPDGAQEFDRSRTIPAAVKFLKEEHEKPFFISIGLLDPHCANRGDRRVFIETKDATQPEDIDERARYVQPWPHMPDNIVTRREMANFKMGVEHLDQDIGRLLEVLDTPALRENTLVIFTTDHGVGVCEMKATLKDTGTGVFMIFRGPTDEAFGKACAFEGGTVVDTMTQHLDLFPTFVDITGEEANHELNGKSLIPLVTGESEQIHDAIFTEQTYHFDENPRPMRAVRTDRYKYIRSYKSDQVRGVDRGTTQIWLEQFGYAEMPTPDEQLYDLYFDPTETNNLADRPGHEEILDEMRQRLHTWMKETEDPLIDGVIPIAPGQM